MENRYIRNMNMLSVAENESLKRFKVCVIGCGGLGGYIIQLLGRLGIGEITAVDGDVFEASNLNRQPMSDETVLGRSKAVISAEKMALINSDIKINPINSLFNVENGKDILMGHDVIVDALDNISSRKLLAIYCSELNLPLVHGAIAGWYGQVSTLMPGDKTFSMLYADQDNKGVEVELGNPSFTPAMVASIEVSEVLKLLLKRGKVLQNKLLTINLLENDFEVIDL